MRSTGVCLIAGVVCLSACGLVLDYDPPREALVLADAGPRCGNSVVEGDELCDDGDEVAGDGCDPDCTFSCGVDSDCPGADCVTGVCDVASHTCRIVVEDIDGDGYPPTGECGGTDCDDGDADVNPGVAFDGCDLVDDDCDGDVDEDDPPIACWTDRDGDGHTDLPLVRMCSVPSCPSGFEGLPVSDCYDSADDPIAAEVRPGQEDYFAAPYMPRPGRLSFDYNCDGVGIREFPMPGVCPPPTGGTCASGSGFLEPLPLPACGESGSFVHCADSGAGCVAALSSAVQRCR